MSLKIEDAIKLIAMHSDYLHDLYMRYLDEREYEDFEQYKNAIKSKFENVEITKFRKNPFSFDIKIDDYIITVTMKVRSVSYKAYKL